MLFLMSSIAHSTTGVAAPNGFSITHSTNVLVLLRSHLKMDWLPNNAIDSVPLSLFTYKNHS